MARFRISTPARADLAAILATSQERWGDDGRARYAALLAAALQAIGRDATGPMTRDRDELLPGIRSYHTRNVRKTHGVQGPVHVVFYRATGPLIEVVRVLHERVEPAFHLNPARRSTIRRRGK